MAMADVVDPVEGGNSLTLGEQLRHDVNSLFDEALVRQQKLPPVLPTANSPEEVDAFVWLINTPEGIVSEIISALDPKTHTVFHLLRPTLESGMQLGKSFDLSTVQVVIDAVTFQYIRLTTGRIFATKKAHLTLIGPGNELMLLEERDGSDAYFTPVNEIYAQELHDMLARSGTFSFEEPKSTNDEDMA